MTAPNILFLQVDQLAAESLSCYGNSWVQTPNLDRLAARGTVVETCYCNFPLCSPSRASMATGQLASTIGAYDNAAELPAHVPTYAHYLRDLGYHTALSGKMHFIGPDQHHGFHDRLTPDLYPADFAWVPNWEDEGERDTNDTRGVTVSGVAARTTQMDFDESVTQAARQFIYDAAKRTGPFFLQVSYTHPHEPYLCLREDWDVYEGVDIPAPRVSRLDPDQHDAHAARIMADFGMLDHVFDASEIARARRAHYALVTYVDKQIGAVLTALEASGQAENTVVVFTSDHGDFLGERGMWFKKHFYDPSARVPLIFAGPGVPKGRFETQTSLVDLLPTFCGFATGGTWASEVEHLAGEDLSQELAASARDRWIQAEYLAEAALAPIYMLRRGKWKYVWSAADPALLFDMEADPDERHNRSGDPELVALEAQFAAETALRWDDAAVTRAIRLSQKRRGLVQRAHAKGGTPRWNHDETADQPVRWYRGDQGYNTWAFDHLPEQGGDRK